MARSGSEKRLRQHMQGVRLSADELSAIRDAAEREGVTVSEFVRSAATAAAHRPVIRFAPHVGTGISEGLASIYSKIPATSTVTLAGWYAGGGQDNA